MSSVKSSSSAGESTWKELDRHDGRGGEIIRMGYLKKLKTMRKKFFVLRGESSEASARLEYYDSEKKWRTQHSPKRNIALKTCFNINRRLDTKHKFVIALYTKDDCFCLVLETEEDLEEWLKALLSQQQGEDVPDGEQPKPTFEHVWQVTVQKKGLGNSRNILGPFLLCLTDKTLSLVRMCQDEKPDTYEFSLMSIRRCGHSDCFFYMEVGRSSCTGAGDLWMQTEDTNIAQNMHAAILNAMSKDNSKEELAPRPRTRSSSANEATKPITVRRNTHIGSTKPANYYSASEEAARAGGLAPSLRATSTYCEHLPTAPAGSIPEPTHTAQVCAGSLPGSFHCHHYHHRAGPAHLHHPPVPVPPVRPSQRRHSVSAMCVSSVGGGAGPTHQRTYSFPLSEPQAQPPALPPWETRRGSTGRMGKRSGSTVRSTTAGRERCDSMPSRARTTSEGHHQQLPHPSHSTRGAHLVPVHGNRPHSMYSRGISYSPPVGSSPVSPASGACSTDSAGSSLSIDEGDGWSEEGILGVGRYGHSLTPDEPVILEEMCGDEYAPWPAPGVQGNNSSVQDEKLNYLPMDRVLPALSLPIQPVVPATVASSAPHRKISPNLSSSGFKSGSPSQGSYMEGIYSPCGSSPLDTTGGYMAMSPGGGPTDSTPRTTTYCRAPSSSNHSRGSSLAEETPDGYVPMAPALTDDGYVDMDPLQPAHTHEHYHHGEMSPASSCSITSGTPSTDLRFSEYHLEKVSSYFTPSEEDETSSLDRPIRAYSVGSRPDNLRKSNRLEIANQADASRERAFSVGSRTAPGVRLSSRPLAHDLHASRYHTTALTPPHQHHLHSTPSASGKKSSSAPLLSNSWSGSSTLRHLHGSSHSSVEPMDDLMEMDFTRNTRPVKPGSAAKILPRTGKPDTALPPHYHQTSAPHDRLSVPQSSSAYSAGELSGYMEMSPRSTTVSSPKTPAPLMGPYVEMRPSGSGDVVSASPPKLSVSARVSPKSSVSSGPYVEMKVGPGGDVHAQNNGVDVPSRTKPISVAPRPLTSSSVSPKSHVAVGPYVEMKTGSGTTEVNSQNMSSSPAKPTVLSAGTVGTLKSFAEEDPYVEMKAGQANSCSITNAATTVSMTRPISTVSNSGAYLEMRLGHGDLQAQSSHTATPVTSASKTVVTPSGVSPKSVSSYVDMRTVCGTDINHQNFPTSFSAGKQSGVRKPTSPIQEEYMDMSFKPGRKISRQENNLNEPVLGVGPAAVNRTPPVDTPQPKKPPDGYVEMSWSRGSKPSQKSSLEDYKSSSSTGQEDYMNMSYEARGGNTGSSRRKERRGSRKDKNRHSSQPIAIQPKDTAGKVTSASTSPVFSFGITSGGRKTSTGTPPKMPPAFLPLGNAVGSYGSSSPSTSPFSSLRRTSRRKTSSQRSEGSSRRESGDMNSGLTTPTGSTATIFPFSLNSPGSPMKPFPGTSVPKTVALTSAPGLESGTYESPRKCSVDATSGTVRISYSYHEMQISASSAGSNPPTPDSSSSSEQPTPVNAESVRDITNVDEPSSHDYVNYSPQQLSKNVVSSKDQDQFGDYAIMRPVLSTGPPHEAMRKISAPVFGVMNKRVNNLHQSIAGLTLSTPSLSSPKTSVPLRDATPPIVRKSSFNQSVLTSLPVFRPISKFTSSPSDPEVSNGPKVVTSSASASNRGSTIFNRQLSSSRSSASDSGKILNTSVVTETTSNTSTSRGTSIGRQLSRSSSGSSDTGKTFTETGKNQNVVEEKDSHAAYENLMVVNESGSGTVSPVLSQAAASSRPPSVSSERELHYASLDLAPSGSEGEDGARSPRSFKTQSSLTESSTSSPSPNPVSLGTAGGSSGEAFTYAEIDFAKSEGLRNVSTLNRKVRH